MWVNNSVFQGGGECGALMAALDWRNHPLGEPTRWSAELRTLISIALGAQQPMLIVWGPEQTTLYNDGYAAMCGQRHPAALGRPFRELWFDIWAEVDPIITAAYQGISTSMDDIEFLMHRNGYPEETHFSFSYTPVRSPDGEVLGMFCACTETTREVIQRREREQERERLKGIFEIALGAVAVLTGPQHVVAHVNPDYEMLVGHRDIIGRPIAHAMPEIAAQGFDALLDQVYRSGKPYIGKAVPVALQRTPDAPLEQRMLDFLYQPIRDRSGQVEGIFVQALDVTEQHLLNRELAHRLKNQLSLVLAIIGQTLRSTTDPASAQRVLEARIAVLAHAHDAVISGAVGETTVRDIMRSAIALQDDENERVKLDGPDIDIGARAALSLTLILHELLTNAIKYGALSTCTGQVEIHWKVQRRDAQSLFLLRWRERGGPPVTPPTRTGAGTRLIRAGLTSGPHASVALSYAREGVECALSADLARLQAND